MKPSLRRIAAIVFTGQLLAVATLVLALPSTTAQRPAATITSVRPSPPRLARRRAAAASSTHQKEIARLVNEVDARNIEQTIRKLVSFGTRNTLSVQNDPNRGIGAARDWLFSEFSKVAEESAGRMTVENQTFEQPKAARVPARR